MPRISNVFHRLFPLSLPSLNSYIAFSIFIFTVGVYYSYRIGKLENNIENGHPVKHDEFSIDNEYIVPTHHILNFAASVKGHRFLFYVMINTCCALICVLGKSLMSLLFGALSNQEDSTLRKFFRRFVSAKLTFLVFISQHNLFEDISIWTPWLGLHALFLLLLEVANLRLANAHNVISNNSLRHRLFATTSLISVSSLLMLLFVFGIRNYINNLSYCLFLTADCSLLLLQSSHLLLKLFMLVDANAHRSQQSSASAHYFDLAYEMIRDCLEFANYLHMIFYSQLAITYCFVFLVVQAQHYYRRISSKIRKYLQQQELMRHINNNYGVATEEDLLKNDQCTICWQPMKSARKLPCAHIFHEHCLRRWLEQDSSCAICRKTLELHLPRPQQAIGGIEENGLQVFLEAFSPQNNRFARWWMRYLFESFNDEQAAAMVNQVSEMFPQIPVETIRNLINTTGSPAVAIELLLGRNGQNMENLGSDQQNQQLALNEEVVDSSDESSESADAASDQESEANHQGDVGADNNDHRNQPISPSETSELLTPHPRLPFGWTIKNQALEQKMLELLMANRRKYLESTRALNFHA